MGLDELHLRVLATSSDDEIERRNAHRGIFTTSFATINFSVILSYSAQTFKERQTLGPRSALYLISFTPSSHRLSTGASSRQRGMTDPAFLLISTVHFCLVKDCQ